MDTLTHFFGFLDILDSAERPILNNMPSQWLSALVVSAVSYLLIYLLRRVALTRLVDYAQKTSNKIDDVIASLFQKTGIWFIVAICSYLGSLALNLDSVIHVINRVLFVIVLLQIGVWASFLLTSFFQYWLKTNHEDTSKNTAIVAFRYIGKVVIWVLILLLILDNMGIEVVSLMAGLGVGGIAVALAVQNILGDVFSSISIVLDKPFEIGDFIIVGDSLGTVEYVGLKTTRVRSLSGEQLVISNSDLLSSRIRNYKRMFERRMLFTIGVTYQTPRSQLLEIPRLIKEIVEQQSKVRFERAHLKDYGDSAILYEYVYWVLDSDMGISMDIQQSIHIALYDAFKERDISFAYPTQAIHLVTDRSM